MIEELKLLASIVMETGNPIALWGLIVFISIIIAIPIVWSIYKTYSMFNFEFIKQRKFKLLEKSLSSVNVENEEKKLLEECRNQELFFIVTGIHASKMEREQIKEWTTKFLIPLELIRNAWPEIKVNNNKLITIVSIWWRIFFWYSISVYILLLATAALTLFYIIPNLSKTANYISLIFPTFLTIISLLVIRSIKPISYLMKIEYRLKTSNETSQKGDVSGKT